MSLMMTFGLGALPGTTDPPSGDSLLSSLVSYLKASPSVTSLLSDPAAIFLDLSNWESETTFLLVESYDEILPGETNEDEPVELTISAYAPTVNDARSLIRAVMAVVDSPAINPDSSRTEQFTWTGGATKGVMRNRSRVRREPYMVKNGDLCYEAKVDYQFWVTPEQ